MNAHLPYEPSAPQAFLQRKHGLGGHLPIRQSQHFERLTSMNVEEVKDVNCGNGQVHVADNHNSVPEASPVNTDKTQVSCSFSELGSKILLQFRVMFIESTSSGT